jgi:hypothetical protein
VGSAIGEEALAMLKAKQDMKKTAGVATTPKKDQAKDKRARDTTSLVTTGSNIMKRRITSGLPRCSA